MLDGYDGFHLFKPVSGSCHATPTPSGDGSDAVADRRRHYAGPFPLDQPRWQLPNGPTFFSYQYQLVSAPLGAESSPAVGARRGDLEGRRGSGRDEMGQQTPGRDRFFARSVGQSRAGAVCFCVYP